MRNKEIVENNLNEQVNSPHEAEKGEFKPESPPSKDKDNQEILKRRAEQKEAIARMIRELTKKHSEPAAREKPEKKPVYPLDKEKAMLTALRRGEPDEAKNLLNELIAVIIFSNSGELKAVQLHAFELVVLLSRVEVAPGNNEIYFIEENYQSLKQVQEAVTVDELTDIIYTVIERVSNFISSFRGSPHAAALRRAENFITENYTKKLSLKEIAAVAGLSPPYFSTIFKEEMGENLSKYLNRLRVEKASSLLLETDMTLSEIAACCCFEDQSWFSKIFKAFTGVSPGKYRNQGGGVINDLVDNNLSQAFRKAMVKKPSI